MTRVYLVRVASLALVLGLLLTACGAPSGPAAPAAQPAATQAPAAQAPAGQAPAPTQAPAAQAPSATQASAAQAPGGAAVPDKPSKPVKLTIIDVAGNLQLTKASIESYKKANPDKVTDIEYQTAPAPELPAKIKAQQDANKLDIAVVLTGFDGLAAGVEQGLWTKLTPDYRGKLGDFESTYLEPAKRANDIGQGYGVVITYYPSGPLFMYNPSKVPTPPTTIDELKAWIKANPGKFMYARPANSGPGRTLLMGLPYILGDKDPKDPVNGWEKTWAFLKEIDQSIDYYPTGTGATMQELGEGTRWIIAGTTGWDMNPRILGTVPKNFGAFFVKDFVWVGDAHFVVIPKGLDADRMSVALDLIKWLLQPQQQANAYDNAYFYPGPAVKGVTLDMAPKENQDAVRSVMRPEFDDMIAKVRVEMPLQTKTMVSAFDLWDKAVGAKTKK